MELLYEHSCLPTLKGPVHTSIRLGQLPLKIEQSSLGLSTLVNSCHTSTVIQPATRWTLSGVISEQIF